MAGVHGWINTSLLPPPLRKALHPAQHDSKKPACPHQGWEYVCPSHHQLSQDVLFAFTIWVFLCCKASGKRLLRALGATMQRNHLPRMEKGSDGTYLITRAPRWDVPPL